MNVLLPRLSARLVNLPVRHRTASEGGMSTAEYAVGTVAACGFAALLFKILTSSQVRKLLVSLVTRALNLAG